MQFIISIYKKAKDVIITPVDFWKDQNKTIQGDKELFFGYYLPLTLLAAVATFLGTWFSSSHFYIGIALGKTIRLIFLFIVQYYIIIYLINKLIPAFGGNKNIFATKMLTSYSLTPLLLVAAVTGLFPVLYIIDILGLYSFYIFWTGSELLLEIPKKKRISFNILTFLLILIVLSLLSILLSRILKAFY